MSSSISSVRGGLCLYRRLPAALLLLLVTAIPSVHPAQNSLDHGHNILSNDSPFSDDDDPFGQEKDPLTTALEDGSDIWEDKCFKVGGQVALDNWLKAQEDLLWCVMQNFHVLSIKDEIEAKKATGDLDLVFKKYCGDPVQKTRPCIIEFLEVSGHCLRSKDREGLNVTMKMIDSAIDFVCHNSGDRMALFMAEKGMECLTTKQEGVLSCVNKSVPELFKTVHDKLSSSYPGARRRSVDPVIVFNQKNCRRGDQLRNCVEQELLRCDDPTPSNVINAMFIAMWNSTPCRKLIGPVRLIGPNLSNGNRFKHSWALNCLKFLVLSLHLLLPSTGIFTSISMGYFGSICLW